MLEVNNLAKSYAGFQAVRGISFSLEPGEIFGFIGSNGAGKTTTIRMIATLLEPSAGSASVDGFDIWNDPMEVRRRLGYMPDFFGLYDDVKVWEYLDFWAAIYSIPARERNAVIDNVLELTDLTVKKQSMVSSLSRGMQQRLCLAKCLVHDPMVLLLDEPASGLDPRARAELKELIAELGKMGKIIVISSHILPELADFCTSVGIIEQGEMKAVGPISDISRNLRDEKILEIRLLDKATEAGMFLHGKPGVLNTHVMGSTTLKVEFNGDHQSQAELLAALISNEYMVIGFTEEAADLEDVFLKLTSGAVQ